MKERGYRTVGVQSNKWLKAEFGFDRYVPVRGLVSSDRVTQTAIQALTLARQEGTPLFLFLHYYDAHSDFRANVNNRRPYFVPPGFEPVVPQDPDYVCKGSLCATEFLIAANRAGEGVDTRKLEAIESLYAAGVRFVDSQVGELLKALKSLGLYDEALILVTADHGEGFMEHGQFLHDQTYEETTRVPLVIKFPENRHAGEQRQGPFALMDLMPTVIDSVGAPVPAYRPGQSLLESRRLSSG